MTYVAAGDRYEKMPYRRCGRIEQRCGEDAWMIALTDRSVAELEDGTPASPDAPAEDLYFPLVFRDGSELRTAPPAR
jgi:hypothetical protein